MPIGELSDMINAWLIVEGHAQEQTVNTGMYIPNLR